MILQGLNLHFIEGYTSVPHDSESAMDMGSCRDPGCYTRPIVYKATSRQMMALIDISSKCRQSIRVSSFE